MRHRHQDGYALLVIMLALSMFVIMLAQVLPNWATEAKRLREQRAIDYGRQYRTSIQRYFHKNGRYPASIEVLVQHDASGLRYLRQPWQDPLVPAGAAASGTSASGQTDFNGWQVIHFGEAVDAEIVDQPPASMRASLGGIAGPNLSGQPPAPLGQNPIDRTGQAGAGANQPGTPGFGTPTGGPGMNSTAAGPAGGGGGAVIGVAPLSKQPALHAFNGFDIPNDWQFVYNFAQDPTLRTTTAPTNRLTPLAPNAGATPPPPNNLAPPPAGGR